MLKIEIPYPPRELSPNSRCHWSVKYRAAKQAKSDAYLATLAALRETPFTPGKTVQYRIIAHPKTKRRRDRDNLLASCKHEIDGIAQALGVNDCIFECTGVEWAECWPCPTVEILIS